MTIKTTPCEGWPYPTRSELFQRHHIVDLANAMDASLLEAQGTIDLLLSRPAVELSQTVAGQSIAVNTTTNMTWTTTGKIDPYAMFAGGMNTTGLLDRVITRPRFAGLWFMEAMFFTTVTPTTMTEYRMEVATAIANSTSATVVPHTMRSTAGNLTNDLVSGLVAVAPGDQVTVRFNWQGTGGPYTIFCRLRLAFLSMCDDGWIYYENFEAGTTAGWALTTTGTLASSTAWASEGSRSLLLTPPGGVATVKAVGPQMAVPTYLTTTRQLYATAAIRLNPSTPTGPIRVGLDYFDSNGIFISSTSATLPFGSVAPNAYYSDYTVHSVPTNAVTMRPMVEYAGTPTAAQTIYIDEFTIARACGRSTTT